MKYCRIALIASILVICCVWLGVALWPKVDMTFATKGETIFRYEEKDISQILSSENFLQICELFHGKRLYSDNLSCGFSDNVSLVVNETQHFCFAQDSCPIVYWENKNKFFKLSADEYSKLKDILACYGFAFPCV